MDRAACLTVIAAITLACCRHRSTEAPNAPDAAPAPSASPVCAKRATAKLRMSGSYAINPGQPPTPRAWVGLDGRYPPPLVVLLPKRPAIPARAEDLCASTVGPSAITITCLDDGGRPSPSVITRADLAGLAGVGAACLDVDDAIGARDLEPLRAEWAANVAGGPCDADAGARPVGVTIALRPPPAGARYRIAVPGPAREILSCVMARLSIPALGLARELGCVGDHAGPCYAHRESAPPGVAYECSDMDLSSAYVYQVGRTLFFPVAAPEDDEAGPRPSQDAIQSLELPCGTRAEFDVTSFEPFTWEL